MPNSPIGSQKSPLLALVALILFGPFKLSGFLRKQAYTRYFSFGFVAFEVLCIAFSVIAARSTSAHFDYLTFVVSEAYGFPLLWLAIGKPLTKLWEKSSRRVQKFSRDHIAKTLSTIGDTCAKAPLTDLLRFIASTDSWVPRLFELVTVVALGACSLYTGWLAERVLEPLAWNYLSAFWSNGIFHTVVTFVCYGLGLSVAGFFGNLFITAATDTNDRGRALIMSTFVTYASYGLLANIAGLLGIRLAAIPFAILEVFLLTAYGYPLLGMLLSRGLFRRIYTTLKPIVDTFFWRSQDTTPQVKAFRDLFQQSTNIGLAMLLGWHAYAFGATTALPGLVVWLAAAFVILLSFCAFGIVLNNRWGNSPSSALITLFIGVFTFTHSHFAAALLNGYGSLLLAVSVSIASFCLVIPVVYFGFEKLLLLPGLNLITTLGTGLRKLHTFVHAHTFEPIYRLAVIVYHDGYRVETDSERSFERTVMHLTNIAFAFTLSAGAYIAASALIVSSPLLALTPAAAVFLLSYSLLGPVAVKSRAQLSGGFAAFIAGGSMAIYLTPAQTFGLTVSLPVSVITGLIVFGVVYPLLYRVAQTYLQGIGVSLEKPLDAAQAAGTRYIGAPLIAGWQLIVYAWASLKAVFDGLFGGGRKS